MNVDRRAELINVFHDTQEFYAENDILREAVEYGEKHTHLYAADEYPPLPSRAAGRHGSVSILRARTFEAALTLHAKIPKAKIAVLNFASATRPGGGVENGSRAQEESLCRCSTLYPTINQKWLRGKYYAVNRANYDCLHTDACIYSPGVIIFKTDEDVPKRMDKEDFVRVDVITCAAPNLRNMPSNPYNFEIWECSSLESKQLYDLHVKRAKHILHVAAANEADTLILGAFGCGAFRNDPHIVAKAWRVALNEYRDRFDRTVFAIHCRKKEAENLTAFEQVFSCPFC